MNRAPRRSGFLVFTACCLLPLLAGCATSRRHDPLISEWEGGWKPVGGQSLLSSTNTPDNLRGESRKALDAGAYQDALQGFLSLRDNFPDSPLARSVEISFQIAECYFQMGERYYENAYQYYLRVLRQNPPEEMLQTTLGRIYDIGISFLHGRARLYFLGFIPHGKSHGVDILTGDRGLVTNYPYIKYSEDALMEVARYYFENREYLEAERIYEQMVRNYPQSPWNDTAEYQLALSVYRQIRGVEYDQDSIKRARIKFNSYLNHHPRGSQVEEVRRLLHHMSEMEGQRDLNIAKYYLRESYPQAAMLYLRSVFIKNPKTEAAREARKIYENMELRRSGT